MFPVLLNNFQNNSLIISPLSNIMFKNYDSNSSIPNSFKYFSFSLQLSIVLTKVSK